MQSPNIPATYRALTNGLLQATISDSFSMYVWLYKVQFGRTNLLYNFNGRVTDDL